MHCPNGSPLRFLRFLSLSICSAGLLALALAGCASNNAVDIDPPEIPGKLDASAVAATQAQWSDTFTPPQPTFKQVEAAVTPYGKWLDVPVYGKVWKPDPAIVGENWQPYTRGRWIFTDWGWTWVSAFKEWGWAAFHFGRFAHTPSNGWVMVVDITWSPAHVIWRESQNTIGWSPVLPGYSVSEAIRFGSSINIPKRGWVFIQKQDFTAEDVSQHIIPGHQLTNLFRLSSTLRQWEQHGRQHFYTGPNTEPLTTEFDVTIPAYSFEQAQQAFATRLFPKQYRNDPGRSNIINYSEVRLDVDRRLAVVGPDSPKKLPRRKFKKVYQASATSTTATPSTTSKTSTTPRPPTSSSRSSTVRRSSSSSR